ncbi:MAG: twin-arginine translocase subunit TatC [Verrucomicrobiales bacterium]
MFFLAKFIRDKASKLKADHSSGEDEKPFLDHLEDLRKTLFKILITLMVVTIGTFVFNKQLLELIQWPLYRADIPPEARSLMNIGVVEGMMLAIKVSFFSGIILSFPLLVFFLGEFILPGLKDDEKKLVLPSLAVGAALFVIGLSFAYFVVIPMAIEFFYNFSVERGWDYELRAGYYISFAVQMVLVFGISFELPVVVMALVKLEILSHRVMVNTRSTAIVIMVVVSAVITPTTDVFTLSLLAGPLIVLYEICIWLAWALEKKREREEERERQRSLPEATPLPDPDSPDDDGKATGAAGLAPGPSSGPGSATDTSAFDSDHLESTNPPAYDSNNEFDPDESDSDDEIDSDQTSDEASDSDSPTADSGDSDSGDSDSSDSDSGSGDSASEHGDSGDDYWNDPYHHEDHHDYHHDDHHDYYSGPTEELKRSLREELTEQIKAELRIELLGELRKELRSQGAKPRNMSLDPRRTRRPR